MILTFIEEATCVGDPWHVIINFDLEIIYFNSIKDKLFNK